MIPKNSKLKNNYYKPSQFIEFVNSHQQKHLSTIKKVINFNNLTVYSVIYLRLFKNMIDKFIKNISILVVVTNLNF